MLRTGFGIFFCRLKKMRREKQKTAPVFSEGSLVFGRIFIPVEIIEPKTNCKRPKTIRGFSVWSLVFSRIFIPVQIIKPKTN